MSISQKVVFEIKVVETDNETKKRVIEIGLDFEPALIGNKNPEFKSLTEDERAIRNAAIAVAEKVMEALNVKEYEYVY